MTPPDSYQSQRPTDVAWLPSIPAHWSTARGRHIFRIQKRIAGKLGLQVLSVTQTGIKPKDTTTGEGQLSQDYSKYQFVFAGDFVMNHMDLLTGWVDRSGFDGVTSPDYRVFELIDGESDPDFYRLACQVGYIEKLFYAYGQGVSHLGRWRFPADNFKNFVFPKPPLPEQRAAAKAVDRETARIDAMIEKKTRFIWLLKEKRQALITQAVTKGLDPTVPMKDSGVEWIGEVPAHWEVGALKRFWSVTDCKHITATFVEDGIPLASIREVQATYVDLSNAKKTTDKFYKLLIEGGRKPLSGDIVYSRNATVGEAAMVSDEHDSFAMGQDVCLLRHLGEQDTRFMHYQLRSGVVLDQLEVLMVGATFRRVNVDNIRNYIVCAPPPEEQAQIAEHLGGRISRLDSLMEKSALSMQLLQERRSALITAAVTGQIDLRGEAA